MTRVFVFTNHKGGVGKSTSATNIALGITGMLHRANASNCRVLLIDTDSQGHASLVTTGKQGLRHGRQSLHRADGRSPERAADADELHCAIDVG